MHTASHISTANVGKKKPQKANTERMFQVPECTHYTEQELDTSKPGNPLCERTRLILNRHCFYCCLKCHTAIILLCCKATTAENPIPSLRIV